MSNDTQALKVKSTGCLLPAQRLIGYRRSRVQSGPGTPIIDYPRTLFLQKGIDEFTIIYRILKLEKYGISRPVVVCLNFHIPYRI